MEDVARTMDSDDIMVVNVGHLMEHVNEQREAGNQAFKRKQYSEALSCWQGGLDALAQAEGKPMRTVDVAVVVKARSTLHSNKGQALLSMEFWKRSIGELTLALEVDPSNAKALWRRHKAYIGLKAWAEAEADIEALRAPELQAAAGPLLADAGLGPTQLAEALATLREKRDAAEASASASFDDRVEEAAAKGLEALRERYSEVTLRTGLHGNLELAGELADMITRPGGVSAALIAGTYQIDEDDAEVLLAWTQKACAMRDELGYRNVSDYGLV